MSVEEVKRTANEIVELTDQSLRALAPVGNEKRDYHQQAGSLRFVGEQIPISLQYVAAGIERAKVGLEGVRDYNLLAAEALRDMPVNEVTDTKSRIGEVNAGTAIIAEEFIDPVEGQLEAIRVAADTAEQLAVPIDAPPDINNSQSGWTWMHFAYNVLKRVADAI